MQLATLDMHSGPKFPWLAPPKLSRFFFLLASVMGTRALMMCFGETGAWGIEAKRFSIDDGEQGRDPSRR